MKMCKTCRSWNNGINPKDTEEWGWCERCDASNGYPVDPTSLAHAVDCEGFQASLETHSTFGCTQYQKQAT